MKNAPHLKLFIVVMLIGLVFACSENIENQLDESRSATQQLGGQLKGKLKASLESKGPIEAITVCNVEAEDIAMNVSKNNTLEVGRTSLKVRNSSNHPDVWEKEKLVYFEQQMLSGADAKTLEVYEVTKENNEKWFRYMKAIPTAEVCLVCHGETLAPPIKQRLQTLYPDDQAIGYKTGDLRGAFTVKVKL